MLKAKKYTILLSILLTACSVGPDFTPPTVTTKNYNAGSDALSIQGQQIVVGRKLYAGWWKQFRSPTLDRLIQQAVANNYTLAAAKEKFAQAKEEANAVSGGLWPQIFLNTTAGNQQYGVATFGPSDFSVPPFTYYEVGPSANFLVDIFGSTRRSLEKEQALAAYQGHELDAAYLTLTGQITNTVLTIAVLHGGIAIAQQIVLDDKKYVALLEAAHRYGAATQIDLLNAKDKLNNDRLLLPQFYQQLSATKHALSILLGLPPSKEVLTNFAMSDFTLPQKLPLSLPSQLVRNRPDILAAEAQLHAASAQIGVATANLYPSITLTANVPQEAFNIGNLFNSSATAWDVAGNVTAPLFNGGALRAERRAAIHAYQASLASYQQIVLQAFGQVADTLQALKHDADALAIQEQILKSAASSLQLAKLNYSAGNISDLQLVEAERSYSQARLAYLPVTAKQYQDTIQLFLVFGSVLNKDDL